MTADAIAAMRTHANPIHGRTDAMERNPRHTAWRRTAAIGVIFCACAAADAVPPDGLPPELFEPAHPPVEEVPLDPNNPFIAPVPNVDPADPSKPPVAPADDALQPPAPGQPLLTAPQAVKQFILPPGFRIELVAAEPRVVDPAAITFDARGRLYIAEKHRIIRIDNPLSAAPAPDDAPSVIFADNLSDARAMLPAGDGLLVIDASAVWHLKDADGDGRADDRTRIIDLPAPSAGDQPAAPPPAAMVRSIDNWVYMPGFAKRFRHAAGQWVVEPAPLRGIVRLTHDDHGRMTYRDDRGRIVADLFPPPTTDANRDRTVRLTDVPDDAAFDPFIPFDLLVHRGDQFPSPFVGNLFISYGGSSLVGRYLILDRQGARRASMPQQAAVMVHAADTRFMPVDLADGPDGCLYIADAYWRSAAERASHPAGRIYRLVYDAPRRDAPPALDQLPTPQLVPLLAHSNGWHRDTAQRLLVERPDPAVLDPLRSVVANSAKSSARLHALWTLHGLDALDQPSILAALSDADSAIRSAAVGFAVDHLRRMPSEALRKALEKINPALIPATVSPAAQGPWKRHTIDNSSRGADGVRLADVNRDGLADIVTGWEEGGVIRVYLNPGPARAQQPWPAVAVGKVPSPEDAFFADLDGDGNVDVVSSTEGDSRTMFVHWAPTNPARYMEPGAWTTQPFPAARKTQQWMFAAAMQIDGRHGLDLVVASKGDNASIGWLEAPADPRNLSGWTYRRLCDAGWIMSLKTVDIDGDGDLDILASDRKGATRGVLWLQNLGPESVGRNAAWPVHRLTPHDAEFMFLEYADLNSDRRPDIAAATRDGRITLLLRAATPGVVFTQAAIDNPFGIRTGKAVAIGDIDRDGLPDLVHSAYTDGDRSKLGVTWLQRAGSPDQPQWLPHPISGPEGAKFDRMELIDLDADGDLDVLTCEERDNLGVIWYENPAVQR